MDDKPFAWKQFYAFGLMCTGFAAGHTLAPTYDVVLTVICLEFFAAIEWWMHAVDYLEWRRDYRRIVWGSEPKQIEPEIRKIVDLAEKDNVWQSNGIAVNLLQKDQRWQQFGYAIVNGQRMTQTKWTGKGRPFSKTEFVKRIKSWLEDEVIAQNKGDSSYHPNGAIGWQYFKDLADGRKFIPLPMKESE